MPTRAPAVPKPRRRRPRHDAACHCPDCRHARFAPGPSSTSRKARAALMPYGHGRTHRPAPRVAHPDADTRSVGQMLAQYFRELRSKGSTTLPKS